MDAKIQGKNLVITIPLQTPTPSSSGKTLLYATGTLKNAAEIDGRQLTVTINAYAKP